MRRVGREGLSAGIYFEILMKLSSVENHDITVAERNLASVIYSRATAIRALTDVGMGRR
ncbi:hypothetical protein [Rhodococcus sp. T7]|uniref:hypothetical protein n=1 Tax=Rhodococcus sp. T7 TaxID=627444 RepID=UPI00135B7FB1|nr:hypothetical protein [Rhodococcus sp. T7]KAF0960124.1 hypothetical protein MLGJGCBP_06788 [Rhodococcus sp. T7]